MGFLDLLSGKKKESNSSQVPPPAPGPDKIGAPKPEDSKAEQKDNEKSALPPPPGPNEEKNPFGSNPVELKGKEDDKPASGDFGKQEVLKQESKESPNLEPPKPNSSINPSEPPKPVGGINPEQNNVQNNPQMKQFTEYFDFPKLELPKFPGTEDLEESTQDEKLHLQENNKEEANEVIEKEPFSQGESIQKETQSSAKSYLSQNEMQLNDLKEQLHRPLKIEGSDSSNIGNVESTLRSKTKNIKGPLFIEINNYKRVLHSLDEMKQDLNESQEFVLKLDEFNDKKYNEFERWRKSIEYIHSKLAFVDKTLFKE